MAAVKPEMAYPTFASATATFSPSKWPVAFEGGWTHARFEADARTAAGQFIRHTSPVTERRIAITYQLLSTADRDALAAPDGTGFFYTVGGETFEFKDVEGTIHTVRFAMADVESTPAGFGRWNVSSIEMVVVG